MKKTLSIVAIVFLASAQTVEVAPFYGRQFGGIIDVARGKLLIPAYGSWGFTLDIKVTDEGFIEFFQERSDCRFHDRKSIPRRRRDLAVVYALQLASSLPAC